MRRLTGATPKRGFTLIELLVVIAIIGILAAMLFPVFARARESARKIQCLSNVKNIALAVQMYLTDYDAFPPEHTDRAAFDYLNQGAGGRPGYCSAENYGDERFNKANPYLRWQVILDEYIKNKDVWRCPSARHECYVNWILPQYTPQWWQYYQQNEGKWGRAGDTGGPCDPTFPTGWGGTVTDSVLQGFSGEETGAVPISIGANSVGLRGLSTSAIDDPSWWVVAGDNVGGMELNDIMGMAFGYSYPTCFGISEDDCCKFKADPTFRKPFAPHMGGLNLGFADGHAKWWDVESALTEAGDCFSCALDPNHSTCTQTPNGRIKGLCPYFERPGAY